VNKEIGKIIRSYRKSKNLSLSQISKLLNVDVSTISKWENGKCLPNEDSWKILNEFFGTINLPEKLKKEFKPKRQVSLENFITAHENNEFSSLKMVSIALGTDLKTIKQRIKFLKDNGVALRDLK